MHSSADERALDSLREPAVVCMIILTGRGVERTQSRQADFVAGDGRGSVAP
jgi:hypothetical protein